MAMIHECPKALLSTVPVMLRQKPGADALLRDTFVQCWSVQVPGKNVRHDFVVPQARRVRQRYIMKSCVGQHQQLENMRQTTSISSSTGKDMNCEYLKRWR